MNTGLANSATARSSESASLTRRHWLLCGWALGFVGSFFIPDLLAQEDPAATVRSMSWMTGAKLTDVWLQPTAGLVKIIVDDSQSLRELDLDEIEPAVIFSAD